MFRARRPPTTRPSSSGLRTAAPISSGSSCRRRRFHDPRTSTGVCKIPICIAAARREWRRVEQAVVSGAIVQTGGTVNLTAIGNIRHLLERMTGMSTLSASRSRLRRALAPENAARADMKQYRAYRADDVLAPLVLASLEGV